MTCKEFVELVTAYLDGSLQPARRRAFDEHLALCPGCDRYLTQFRKTIVLLGRVPEESLSSSARQRLLDAFADWRSSPEPGST